MIWKNRLNTKKFTLKPFRKDSIPTKQTNIVLLFLDNKIVPTRERVLMEVGVPKVDAERKGFNSSLFSLLNVNKVIRHTGKHYEAGPNFKEYLKECVRDLDKQRIKNKLYYLLLKNISNSLHFIVAD